MAKCACDFCYCEVFVNKKGDWCEYCQKGIHVDEYGNKYNEHGEPIDTPRGEEDGNKEASS